MRAITITIILLFLVGCSDNEQDILELQKQVKALQDELGKKVDRQEFNKAINVLNLRIVDLSSNVKQLKRVGDYSDRETDQINQLVSRVNKLYKEFNELVSEVEWNEAAVKNLTNSVAHALSDALTLRKGIFDNRLGLILKEYRDFVDFIDDEKFDYFNKSDRSHVEKKIEDLKISARDARIIAGKHINTEELDKLDELIKSREGHFRYNYLQKFAQYQFSKVGYYVNEGTVTIDIIYEAIDELNKMLQSIETTNVEYYKFILGESLWGDVVDGYKVILGALRKWILEFS